MENDPLIETLPIKVVIFHNKLSNDRRVYLQLYTSISHNKLSFQCAMLHPILVGQTPISNGISTDTPWELVT